MKQRILTFEQFITESKLNENGPFKQPLEQIFGSLIKGWYYDRNIDGFSEGMDIAGIPVTFFLRHPDEIDEIPDFTLVIEVGDDGESGVAILEGEKEIKKFLKDELSKLQKATSPKEMDKIIIKAGFELVESHIAYPKGKKVNEAARNPYQDFINYFKQAIAGAGKENHYKIKDALSWFIKSNFDKNEFVSEMDWRSNYGNSKGYAQYLKAKHVLNDNGLHGEPVPHDEMLKIVNNLLG